MHATVLISFVAVALFVGPSLIVAWHLRRPLYVRHYTVDPYSRDSVYKRDVLSVINGAEKHLTMVRGELPYSVYDEEIADALRRANGRGVEITLICGPQVLVPEAGVHPILALASEGILSLYYPNLPQPEHFIEADSTTLYWEEPHLPRARNREVWLFRNSYFRAAAERKRVLAAIENGTVVLVRDARERHQLMTECERELLEKMARARGWDLDKLSSEAISELRDELRKAR